MRSMLRNSWHLFCVIAFVLFLYIFLYFFYDYFTFAYRLRLSGWFVLFQLLLLLLTTCFYGNGLPASCNI